jgi:hypothetical protein
MPNVRNRGAVKRPNNFKIEPRLNLQIDRTFSQFVVNVPLLEKQPPFEGLNVETLPENQLGNRIAKGVMRRA